MLGAGSTGRVLLGELPNPHVPGVGLPVAVYTHDVERFGSESALLVQRDREAVLAEGKLSVGVRYEVKSVDHLADVRKHPLGRVAIRELPGGAAP